MTSPAVAAVMAAPIVGYGFSRVPIVAVGGVGSRFDEQVLCQGRHGDRERLDSPGWPAGCPRCRGRRPAPVFNRVT